MKLQPGIERPENQKKAGNRVRRAAFQAALSFVGTLTLAMSPGGFSLLQTAPSLAYAQDNEDDTHRKRGDRNWQEKRHSFRDLTPKLKERLAQLPPQEREALKLLWEMVTDGLKKQFIAREVTIKARGGETEQWVRWDPKRGMRRDSIRPEGAIFLDNLKDSFFYDPHSKRWFKRDSILPRPEGRIGDTLYRLIKGELRVSLDGEDTVAGRKAAIVRVAPLEGQRGLIRRYWIDRATGVRLKTEEVGFGGKVITSSYYISIDLKPRFRREDFVAPRDADRLPGRSRRQTYKSIAEAREAGLRFEQPGYLPDGFSLRVVVAEAVGPEKNRGRITLRYGNGATAISLVQMPLQAAPPEAVRQLGSEPAAFIASPRGGPERLYLWREGDTCFLLFSSLPDAEVRRIADSVN